MIPGSVRWYWLEIIHERIGFFMTRNGFFSRFLKSVGELHPVRRWATPQGYREVLAMCLPLIASTTVSSLMLFTDRLFLSHYSVNAIAASLPAGIAWVTITSFFLGIASYTSVFVAQYVGAKRTDRAAASLWQGLYFSLVFGLLLSLLYFASPLIFSFGNLNPDIVVLEYEYFGPLILMSPLNLLLVVMSSFMAALGRTKVVMWVSLVGATINIPLNYMLIFGLSIGETNLIPSIGVLGAALATVISWVVSVAIYCFLIFNRQMEKDYGVLTNRRFDRPLFFRLMKYGWPGGLQFFMEIFAFGFFNFAVSRLAKLELASNNIVFSIEALSYFPIFGVGQTISIMVGQAIGRDQPSDGARATKTGVVICTVYVFLMLLGFLFLPHQLLSLFLTSDLPAGDRAFILHLGTVILRFVAAYSIFDGIYLCCFGAIKGSGDVWFPMLAMGFWGIFGLVLPIMILFALNAATIYSLWFCMIVYILCLTATGFWRFKSGRWMTMRVIEPVLNTK
ncbi:MAG: MATE family efflux transporter [Deltaproteobacteria bacterium]|jgi:MATE family multidrug resistance protein|nr:MATE family efflux transporter [Deltaproteobacteria bacterium]